jgi:hypothetical protein
MQLEEDVVWVGCRESKIRAKHDVTLSLGSDATRESFRTAGSPLLNRPDCRTDKERFNKAHSLR